MRDGADAEPGGRGESLSRRCKTKADMASATSGGGGTRSHRRRNRRDVAGAEGGRSDKTRSGMDESDMSPSCVAVSRWRGLVLTLSLEEGPPPSSGVGEDMTTKSSCVKDGPVPPSSPSP